MPGVVTSNLPQDLPLDLPPTSALQKENAALKESGVIVNLTSASPRNRARHTLKFGVVGGGGLCETRTRDQRIKSPLLYRLS